VPSLFEIRVLVEAESDAEVEELAVSFEKVICPYHAGEDHRCPRRWFLVRSELSASEAAEWEELLNE
jgi:hypothetical protein